MKFSLIIRSRVDSQQSIPNKHAVLVKRYFESGTMWPFSEVITPPTEIGHKLVVVTKLKKCLENGFVGQICYPFRDPNASDKASNDDFICIDFNPLKIDYELIVSDVFPRLVAAFDGYRGQIIDTKIYSLDFEKKQTIDDRHGVYRILPVAFYDRQLCVRGFNLSPEEITKRLSGRVESAKLFNDGVLLIERSRPFTLEEADFIDNSIRTILNAKR
jgi:hypothetical protein